MEGLWTQGSKYVNMLQYFWIYDNEYASYQGRLIRRNDFS